jgi:hypothetical protein
MARRISASSSGDLTIRSAPKSAAAERPVQPFRASRRRSTSSNAVEGSTASVPEDAGSSAAAFANGSSVSSQVTTRSTADIPRSRRSSNAGQITTGASSGKRSRAVRRSLRWKSMPVR